MAAAAAVTGAAIAKRLASCNKAARDRAVRVLESWLPSSSAAVSDEELLKIWKGLFYCVWHADKAPVQAALAGRLAALLPALPAPLGLRFLAAFLSTIRREWSGIDHLRLDKFYVLIRRMLHQCFASLQKAAWDPSAVAAAADVLSKKTLLAVDKYPAEGVNYHIAQVFLDEILEFLPLGLGALESLLKPFFAVLETSISRTLVAKVKACVFDRLLDNGHKFLAAVNTTGGDVDSEVEKLGRIALAFGFSKKFLNLASAAATVQSNRKVMFLLHERFSKLEKGCAGKSGMDVLPPVQNGDLGNVSASSSDHVLVQDSDAPATDCTNQSEVNANGSSNSEGSSSKKRKKCKKESGTGKKKKKHAKSECAGGSTSIVNETTKEPEPVAGNGNLAKDEGVTEDTMENGDSITFSEILMSNLQKQFEKVAAEDGMVTPVINAKIKKRKRVKSADGKASNSLKSSESSRGKKSSRSPKAGEDGIATGKSAEKSVKKVRFSMKSNLVWKPHSPLPPQSLRLPPSATPRGSALKKGVPPGPIRETPPSKKVKVKVRASSIKKARKITKSASPSAKRLKKLQNTI